MQNVLLQRCSLGMRIDLADVICTACHSRRRWHSLAATALAKHAAISCAEYLSGIHRVAKLLAHAGGAMPTRHEVTFGTAPPARRPACHVAARW